ncbi:MAG: hypothetical protein JWM41_1898 [Gemmatimonadetes bacterium]|nr:hypothetical protein [Gemmatimonadota bacterium]
MHDTNDAHGNHDLRTSLSPARRTLRSLSMALTGMLCLATTARAQLPGAPVLQNAWATPGIVAAIDLAGGSDGSVYAAAASWTPGSGKFQLSGGGGFQRRTGASSRGVYGIRAAIPLGGASSNFGFGAFIGVGGGPAGTKTSVSDTTASTTEVPLGAAVGWRHAIGATRGLSLYATPSYVFFSGGSKSGGLVRAAIGADLGITRAIGATLGIEFGGTRSRQLGGPSGALYGLGLSYALGHR